MSFIMVEYKKSTRFYTKAGNYLLAMAEREVEELTRSEERRVGKECRSRCSPYH